MVHEEFDKFIKKPGKKVDPEASYPTVGSLHVKIKAFGKDKDEFQWSFSTTYSVLKSMGFRFVQAHATNHAILIENQFVIDLRKNFITKIRKFRQDGRTIYYFDESYCNAHHAPTRVLTDTTVKSAKDAEERGLTTGNFANFLPFQLMKI